MGSGESRFKFGAEQRSSEMVQVDSSHGGRAGGQRPELERLGLGRLSAPSPSQALLPSSSGWTAMLLRWLLMTMLLGRGVMGHMNLLHPLPINSQRDPQTAEAQKDFSLTAPLDKTGSNWPAKLYATQEAFDRIKPAATLVAGEDFEWTLEDGGSCQVGISYDLLKTVAIMASWVGGCPLDKAYTFKVPDIPGAEKALFWWSWFNKTGNREMYNNAAVVAVTGTAKSFTGPTPYRANTFADGTCVNTEGTDQLFPNPGSQTIYGGDYKGQTPTGGKIDGCSYDVTSDVTVTSDGSSAEAPPDTDETTTKKTETPATTANPPAGGTGTASPTGTGATSSPKPTSADDEESTGAATSKGASATSNASVTTASATGTAATPSSSTSNSTDLLAGYTSKEIGFVGAVLVTILLLCFVLFSAMGHKKRRKKSRAPGSGHKKGKKKRHRYEKAQKEETETESSATGSASGSHESTDGSSDEEKFKRRKR